MKKYISDKKRQEKQQNAEQAYARLRVLLLWI